MQSNELYEFMNQLKTQLTSEYRRIQIRAKEDPGTAGDEGENNWAELLRSWLPSNYQVVTKGRIINHTGEASPQVDVLVLHPAYPRHLMEKKYYLAGGVVAAFECKLTLKTAHLKKIFSNASKIKRLYKPRTGTPYHELHQPIIYGVLAHSHSWKKGKEGCAFTILRSILKNQYQDIEHPREMLDIIAIADTATYKLNKEVLIGPSIPEQEFQNGFFSDSDLTDGVGVGYTCGWDESSKPWYGTTLGRLVCYLMERMAYEDPSLRPMAEFYVMSDLDTGGISCPDLWKSDAVFTDHVLNELRTVGTDENKWSLRSTHY
ncbi:hypothetical protein BVH01_21435 [Pseudomonas sp. PA1(2017)]|uniref:DUF6602 domain-containing protein n=1 Tax=Pseudomonas sp. PA1(2017) TaxID=1932113 RepID=UPI0009644509|nr:DUF6602 domain-containing protein [Pseudomonas sp. PA1(2017)]OLU12934.1 hypothetical protein BVH01_21435 [Pseudomonas sp. PA1(2017)]